VSLAPLPPIAGPIVGADPGVPLRALVAEVQAAALSMAADAVEIAPQAAPASAVQSAVQAAAGRQDGLVPLLADLEVAARSPALPAPVLAAVAQVLSLRLPIDPPPSAADLRQAVANSGLFLEAQLASGGAATEPDIKAALLTLGQALESWMGAGASARMASASLPPAPPYRGAPVRGQPPARASLTPDAPIEAVGARLAQETSRALSRQVMLQAASLPDAPHAASPAQGPQWLFEIPLATPQGAAVAQFEIARDGQRGGGGDDDEPTWRAGFSLHLEPMGPVHAKIALSGERVRVGLWAEAPRTAERLAAQGGDLSDALRAEAFTPSVSIAPGAPAAPAPTAGRLLDRAL
jgi:hypothetical protein